MVERQLSEVHLSRWKGALLSTPLSEQFYLSFGLPKSENARRLL